MNIHKQCPIKRVKPNSYQILDLLILLANSFCTIFSTWISFKVYNLIYSSFRSSFVLSPPVDIAFTVFRTGFSSTSFFVTTSNQGWFSAYSRPIRFSGSVWRSWLMRSLASALTPSQIPSFISYYPLAVRSNVYSILWFANASLPLSLPLTNVYRK